MRSNTLTRVSNNPGAVQEEVEGLFESAGVGLNRAQNTLMIGIITHI